MKVYDEAYYNMLLPMIWGTVLDIGCGACMFAKRYAEKDVVSKVYCVDKFPINERYHNPKFEHVETNITDGFSIPEKANVIVSTEFIEHITREQLEPLLKIVKEHLEMGGSFIGSTPDKKVPTTNPYHLYEYTRGELEEILKEHFEEVEMHDTGQNCVIWHAQYPLL